ncbi:MAG: hypothetical protein RR508_06185 [Oscillospiraceae bacterium]
MVDVSRFKVEVRVNDDFHDDLKAMVDRSHILTEMFCDLFNTEYRGKPCDILLEVIAETDKKIVNEMRNCLADDCLEFKIVEKQNTENTERSDVK